jgi:effector-binding domain-containing protein
MGIRVQTPMKGMSKTVGLLFKELNAWGRENGLEPAGPLLLRYYVIDMAGEMDIEVGIPVAELIPENEVQGGKRVHVSRIPPGHYASLVYVGSGYTGNKALVEWAHANGLQWDRWNDPKGDAFRCRYESYLTDPRLEPRKTKWEVEVAIKLTNGEA